MTRVTRSMTRKMQALQARVEELEKMVGRCRCGVKEEVSGTEVPSDTVREVKVDGGSSKIKDIGVEQDVMAEIGERESEDVGGIEIKARQEESEAPVESDVMRETKEVVCSGVVDQPGKWSIVGGSRFWRPTSLNQEDRDKVETEQEGWEKAKSVAKQDKFRQAPSVSTSNRFSILTSVDDSGKELVDNLVVGDSRVRPLGRTFCRNRDKCVVRPGAKIADVDSVIKTELERCSPKRVIVQVGVNNVGPRASVKIVNDYHSLLQRLKDARKPVYVTGILPRLRASSEWFSRALALNSTVKQLCLSMGLCFVDLWDQFYGCDRYYLRDGLHLSDEGARVLGVYYRNSFQGN